MNPTPAKDATSPETFASGNDVRWCPGCGDYAVLKALQKAFAQLGLNRDEVVIVSGIGCSSRLPYYVSTYGFHTVHGRAPTIATGIKLMKPDLEVWLITGDGDGLSIGLNHLYHLFRRNIAVKVVLFNNGIYGLTKGQPSPTSETGLVTSYSPTGTIEEALNPVSTALVAGASFVARVPDTDVQLMTQIFEQAHHHQGSCFIEVLVNCPIYNHGIHHAVNMPANRADHSILLEHGSKLLFGKNREVGLGMNADLEFIKIAANDDAHGGVRSHNEMSHGLGFGVALAQLRHPDFPVAFGVFRRVQRPIFEQVTRQKTSPIQNQDTSNALHNILRIGKVWTINEDEGVNQ